MAHGTWIHIVFLSYIYRLIFSFLQTGHTVEPEAKLHALAFITLYRSASIAEIFRLLFSKYDIRVLTCMQSCISKLIVVV